MLIVRLVMGSPHRKHAVLPSSSSNPKIISLTSLERAELSAQPSASFAFSLILA